MHRAPFYTDSIDGVVREDSGRDHRSYVMRENCGALHVPLQCSVKVEGLHFSNLV